MPKHTQNDHDAIVDLVRAFEDFKEQDSKDKQLIRNDIKELKDGVVNRLDNCEIAINKLNDDKSSLQRTMIELDQRTTRIETTIYGPNRDGKNGGAEAIVNLKDSINSIWKTIAIYSAVLAAIHSFEIYMIMELFRTVTNLK